MKVLDESSTLEKCQCLKRQTREPDILLEKGLQLRRHFGITDVPVIGATRCKANRWREIRSEFCKWNATEGKEGHVRLCPEVTGGRVTSRVTSYHVIFSPYHRLDDSELTVPLWGALYIILRFLVWISQCYHTLSYNSIWLCPCEMVIGNKKLVWNTKMLHSSNTRIHEFSLQCSGAPFLSCLWDPTSLKLWLPASASCIQEVIAVTVAGTLCISSPSLPPQLSVFPGHATLRTPS
jgi:hypothetical protein